MIKSLFAKTGGGRSGWRVFDYAIALGILALIALIVARLEQVASMTVAGVSTVADGDTLVVAGERIRMTGIDAPELDQICSEAGKDYACGRRARMHLVDLIAGQTVSCEGGSLDRYERLLATCFVGETDLNGAMVEAGWAVSWGGYRAEEQHAREGRVGLWAGEFDLPRDWRAAHGQVDGSLRDLFATARDWLRRFFGTRKMNLE